MAKSLDILIVGPFEVNCYLYWDNRTKGGVILDPGDNGNDIIKAVNRAGFMPRAILLTHGHADHIAAVTAIKDEFKIPVVAGTSEVALLADPAQNFSVYSGAPISLPTPEKLAGDEDLVTYGGITLRVLATPGHTPGGICFLDETEGVLFCGDTLFQGSIGRTDLPCGSTSTLLESIQKKILALPDAVICYPGHGPRTTVGAERRSNPFLTGAYLA